MSAALSADPPKRQRRVPPEAPVAPPKPRILNKRDLCREAGISRTTLDERIARDPHFPILRRGGGNGDSWEFDAEAALARLADDLKPDEDLSPNQRFMELRAKDLERKQAIEAGGLLIAEQMRSALGRGLTGLRRDFTGPFVAEVAKALGLTKEQQRLLRGMVEDRLRTFVAGLALTGLPDAEE